MMERCFFAYPSEPPGLVEAVEDAMAIIDQYAVVTPVGWKSAGVTGRYVIKAICDAIDSCGIFCCDLTGMNPNVMFELGYAIAHRKRLWPFMDETKGTTKSDFEKLRLLRSVGYVKYVNQYEIAEAFSKEPPSANVAETLIDAGRVSDWERAEQTSIFALRSRYVTPVALAVSRELDRALRGSSLELLTDDPREASLQALDLYIQSIEKSFGVILHLSARDRPDYHVHNVKYSLIAGIAHGMGRRLLMVAEEPYSPPVNK